MDSLFNHEEPSDLSRALCDGEGEKWYRTAEGPFKTFLVAVSTQIVVGIVYLLAKVHKKRV